MSTWKRHDFNTESKSEVIMAVFYIVSYIWILPFASINQSAADTKLLDCGGWCCSNWTTHSINASHHYKQCFGSGTLKLLPLVNEVKNTFASYEHVIFTSRWTKTWPINAYQPSNDFKQLRVSLVSPDLLMSNLRYNVSFHWSLDSNEIFLKVH